MRVTLPDLDQYSERLLDAIIPPDIMLKLILKETGQKLSPAELSNLMIRLRKTDLAKQVFSKQLTDEVIKGRYSSVQGG